MLRLQTQRPVLQNKIPQPTAMGSMAIFKYVHGESAYKRVLDAGVTQPTTADFIVMVQTIEMPVFFQRGFLNYSRVLLVASTFL